MPSTLKTLLIRLAREYPLYQFVAGTDFMWSPETRRITYRTPDPQAIALLLHELGHAELGHADYQLDIELLRLEAHAWSYAQQTLAPRHGLAIDELFVQDCLEDYREWLHARSQCPNCQQTGLQTKQNTYSCINCRYSWRVNNARRCYLRRSRLPVQDHSV